MLPIIFEGEWCFLHILWKISPQLSTNIIQVRKQGGFHATSSHAKNFRPISSLHTTNLPWSLKSVTTILCFYLIDEVTYLRNELWHQAISQVVSIVWNIKKFHDSGPWYTQQFCLSDWRLATTDFCRWLGVYDTLSEFSLKADDLGTLRHHLKSLATRNH